MIFRDFVQRYFCKVPYYKVESQKNTTKTFSIFACIIQNMFLYNQFIYSNDVILSNMHD